MPLAMEVIAGNSDGGEFGVRHLDCLLELSRAGASATDGIRPCCARRWRDVGGLAGCTEPLRGGSLSEDLVITTRAPAASRYRHGSLFGLEACEPVR